MTNNSTTTANESSYTKQANDILTKMGVKFSTKFIGYGKHFSDDKESRDRFTATFSRKQSVTVAGTVHQVVKRFSIKFGQSTADSTGNGDNAPTAYDVITCLEKNGYSSFEDFCREMGYDTDSRTAERTYKAVQKEFEKVSKFFSSEELEQLQEVQ